MRYLGVFLPDPLAVPGGVTGYLARQLEISDPSCVQRYTERRTTRFEHADEIKASYGLREFEAVEKDLREWVDARAWTTCDGPKTIFTDAVRWLRERDVLLPGVTVLARLVAQVREEAYQRLLDSLAVVSEAERFSPLERWRRGPAKASGLNMVKTLEGQVTAAAKGNHGGRPKVVDDDSLTFAIALKDKGVPVPQIAKKLTIKTGKNAGKSPSVASLYRALAEAEEQNAQAEAEIAALCPPVSRGQEAAPARS